MKQILTKDAPQPIGPYSQGILADNTLYCSGQIALDPVSNDLITDNISNETTQVLKNIQAVLSAAEMNFSHVVKTSIFLSDMDHFGEVNNIYESWLNMSENSDGDNKVYPARETVAVKTLPKKVNVEISVIAIKG